MLGVSIERESDNETKPGIEAITKRARSKAASKSSSKPEMTGSSACSVIIGQVSQIPQSVPQKGTANRHFKLRFNRHSELTVTARDIADELTAKGVVLSLGGNSHDPTDPVGRLLFNVLGMVAEFEADLIRMRTREGMAVAKAKGRLKGKQPKLSKTQRKHLLTLHDAGEHTQAELAELFRVSRTTVYRELQRRTI